ncbi:MAG TPA: tripartite tricarboxylate transporter substrate-binding protein, partial [Roseomonas sp.]
RAKAQPGTLNYATSGSGGALQLVTLLFLQAAGLQMQEVPYRGSAPAAQDLVAGRLSLLYDASITSFPLALAGQARALAVSSTRRSVVMPDVPTIVEAGYPDAVFSVWQAVLAPRGTPQPIIDAMQQAITAVLAEPALRQRFIELGAETVLGNTPAEAQRYVAAEMDRWQAVLRTAGVQPQ